MQFLHMIPPSTRTIGSFVKMIEEYFPEDEHVFYSTKKIAANDDLFDNDRVQVMTGTDRANKAGHVRDALKQADVIIYAGSLVNPAVLDGHKPDAKIYDSAYMHLDEVIEVMKKAEDGLPPEIQAMADERAQARKDKNWKRSDELRDALAAAGYLVKDTPQGQNITKA